MTDTCKHGSWGASCGQCFGEESVNKSDSKYIGDGDVKQEKQISKTFEQYDAGILNSVVTGIICLAALLALIAWIGGASGVVALSACLTANYAVMWWLTAKKLKRLDALLRAMQREAVDYLVPGGCGTDLFVSRILQHLDGPEQRAAQGRTE